VDVETAIKMRRSVRRFKDKELPEGMVEKLIELGNKAPSAGNLQARDFIVVRDQATKDAMTAAALDQGFISRAPVDIVVCANMERIAHYGNRGRTLYALQDVAAAVQNILLAAVSEGLGTVWIGAFDEHKVGKILGVPEHIRPLAIIPVGYPDEDPKESSKIPLKELMHYEKW
jgi:nitroreductase